MVRNNMFEFETVIDGKPITLKFKKFSQMPSWISRRLTGRSEAQMWAALSWGLEYPKVWPLREPPVDGEEVQPLPEVSTAVEDGIFDYLPIETSMKCHNDWQNASRVTAGE